MSAEIRGRRGFIERLPSVEELDQKQLPQILRDAITELAEEIDDLMRTADPQRAAQPWDFEARITRLEQIKQGVQEISHRPYSKR